MTPDYRRGGSVADAAYSYATDVRLNSVPPRSKGAAAAPPKGNGTRLVIAESPAKARTIAGYLGKGYGVESGIGHIRDMPDKAAEIPEKFRAEPWARLGV